MLEQPDISDFYRELLNYIKKKVQETPEKDVIGLDPEEWASYFEQKCKLEAIKYDESREWQLDPIGSGDPPLVRLYAPIIPSDTIKIIMKHQLRGAAFSFSYSSTDIEYDISLASLTIKAAGTEAGINKAKQRIREQVIWWNESIESKNPNFCSQIREIIEARRKEVLKKRKYLNELVEKVGIPLKKKMDINNVLTIVLPTKKKIQPIMPQPKREKRLFLERDKLDSIIHLIDNQCRQFERSPTVYAKHSEEDLRDLILSSLNAIFEGAAVGEAFQVLGRADIHLRIAEGEIFISECKYWSGPSSVEKVTNQILERLTWHESYGVVIIFSKRKDFGIIRDKLYEAIPTLENYVAGLRKVNEHHFVCRFNLPSDSSKNIEVHYLIYNLYISRPSKRSKLNRLEKTFLIFALYNIFQ